MDANKLSRLQEINYRVCKVCGLCQHGNFPNNEWGTCDLYNYEHLKHSKVLRELSINRSGLCDHFDLDEIKATELGAYKGFI